MVAMEINLHEVWCSNMEEEFANLRMLLDDYPYVAMDTEFPGVIATPLGTFRAREGFNYQQLACNVNILKLIQVGITLVDEQGRLPPGKDVWQFNFQFNLGTDLYSTDSIELLRSSGFDFNRHQNEGILMEDFGELLTTSGLLVDKRITWLTFHSCFDFGYLLRSVLLGDLPMDEAEFLRYHKALFPNCFDIKMFLKQPGPVAAMLRGSLQDVADQLQVARIGQSHQAGSDSLLTAMTFFKLKERFFCDCWDEDLKNRVMPRKQANKTRKRTGKDLDEIQEDFLPEKQAKLVNQPLDLDLPGDGQFYCIECSRYFIDASTMSKHKTTKLHKRRVKVLREPAHTQKDADAAAGLGG